VSRHTRQSTLLVGVELQCLSVLFAVLRGDGLAVHVFLQSYRISAPPAAPSCLRTSVAALATKDNVDGGATLNYMRGAGMGWAGCLCRETMRGSFSSLAGILVEKHLTYTVGVQHDSL